MPDINKIFPSRYLKAGDLNGQEVTVTIKSVKVENVGQSQNAKPVLYFKGTQKGLVLNVTNSKRIATIAGSTDTDDWTGHRIVLYPTETEFGGETVDCLRVKAVKAVADNGAKSVKKVAAKKAKPVIEEPDDPIPVREAGEESESVVVVDVDEDDIDSIPF